MKTAKTGHSISWLLVLTGLIFLTFLPSLKNGFVNFDEDRYLLQNTSIRDFSPSGLGHLFDPHVTGVYIPLTLVTYSVEYHFFQLNPLIYHIDNLALHLLNALLVFWLIYLLSSKFEVALITAAMFAVSPLRVESVAWVMERKDVLFSFFYLGALISYILFIKNRLAGYFWVALFLFLCSLLAKPQAISFPLIMLVIDYYYRRAWSRPLVLEKLPFCLISAVFLIISCIGMFRSIESPQDSKIWFAGYTLLLYFIKSFIPFHLSCVNPVPKQTYGFFSWIVCAFIIAIVTRYSKARDTVFGLLFYLVLMVFPIIGMRYGDGLFYEHYTYLASIGLYFLFAVKYIEWLESFNSRILKQGIIFLLGAYLLVIAWISYERCGIWKNSLTLWSDVIQHNFTSIDPIFATAYNNRGNSYKLRDNITQAMSDYNKAVEINPDYAGAYYNRGLIYFKKGDLTQALFNYNKTIEIKPRMVDVYYNRGNVYFLEGKITQAISDYNKAIEMNPHAVNAYYNLGVSYARSGKVAQADIDYKKYNEMKSAPTSPASQ